MTEPHWETYIIDSQQGLRDLQSYVNGLSVDYVAFDLETDAKQEKLAKIHGIGLAFTDDEAFYIPIRGNKKQLLWDERTLALIYAFIEKMARKRGLLGHNIIYDVLVFQNESGIDLAPFVQHDTILEKHLIDEERPFGLKESAIKYLGSWADKAQKALFESIERNGGKHTKDQMDMWAADTEVLAEYCCWDVLLTRALHKHFWPRVEQEGVIDLYKDEVLPLYKEVTIDMKRRGFRIDVAHFEKLKTEITSEIQKYEDEIQKEIEPLVTERVKHTLDKNAPIKRAGNFPKIAANTYNIPLPQKKDGKITLAEKELKKILKQFTEQSHPRVCAFYRWLVEGTCEFPFDPIPVQKAMYFDQAANKDKRYVFNLNSGDDLRWLLFEKLGLEPLKETDSGDSSVDAETLEEMAGMHPFCDRLIDFKKLKKLDGTYIQGILDRHIGGVIYTGMLQFGTTSGRYSSTDPNLQNIPRLKDEDSQLSPIVLHYTNAIKAGFIAPDGYCILNADYSSLEPVCFAHASGDEKLREVFRKGWDLYSAIAIDVWGLHEYSADKKAPNYLGKAKKEIRQKAKVFCLAVVYGAEAGRISKAMGVSYEEAQKIIDAYLDAYPGLKNYMNSRNKDAVSKGAVRSEFGRLRHLPRAKQLHERYGNKLLNGRWAREHDLGDTRYQLKNQLNNAKNFPIQSLAAHIVNRAMVATVREFRNKSIDGWIAVQVHDEITCIVKREQAEEARQILKKCMEATTQISVPLAADPLIGDNWSEAK